MGCESCMSKCVFLPSVHRSSPPCLRSPKQRQTKRSSTAFEGISSDLQRKLLRQPATKPPPRFPKGTSVSLSSTVTPGTMVYQPAFLPQGIMISRVIGQMAVARPTQVILTRDAISTTPEAAAAASYTQPSEVVVRRKCRMKAALVFVGLRGAYLKILEEPATENWPFQMRIST
eukprot:1941709-Amphidinium_carterae.1